MAQQKLPVLLFRLGKQVEYHDGDEPYKPLILPEVVSCQSKHQQLISLESGTSFGLPDAAGLVSTPTTLLIIQKEPSRLWISSLITPRPANTLLAVPTR